MEYVIKINFCGSTPPIRLRGVVIS